MRACVRWWLLRIPVFLLAVGASTAAHGQDSGTLRVLKDEPTPNREVAGRPVTVTIVVQGYTGTVPAGVPFDGVIVIDQSGSMDDSDHGNARIDAAKSFVDCVAAGTRLAVIAFASNVSVVVPMTEDKAQLKTGIESLRGQQGGETNMYGAMGRAQQLLGSPGDRQRYVILLTDGVDTTGATDADFMQMAEAARAAEIVYFGIALGSQADFARLYMIADVTGGEAIPSPTASALQGVYSEICATASTRVKTRRIVLHEQINATIAPIVRVMPGSLSTPPEVPLTSAQRLAFEATGALELDLGTLGSSESRSITFQVTSDCLTPAATPGSEVTTLIDDGTRANVTYRFGAGPPVSVPVPQRTYQCIAPGDLWCQKRFDLSLNKVTFDCLNQWAPDPSGRDNSLRDVFLVEVASSNFVPKASTASPEPDAVIPYARTDAVLWRFPVIAPGQTAHAEVQLQPTACRDTYHPPIPVDIEKEAPTIPSFASYLSPTRTRKKVLLANFWTVLPSVEDCSGRPDLWVQASTSLTEYLVDHRLEATGAAIRTRQVLARDESESLWIDSASGNGLWNGDPATIASHVTGASAPCRVPGQGDVLRVTADAQVGLYLENSGTVDSPPRTAGGRVDAFVPATGHWQTIATFDLPPVAADQGRCMTVPLPAGTIGSSYLAPYRIPIGDAIKVVTATDPQAGASLRTYLSTHPSVRQALESLSRVGPADVLALLPPASPQSQALTAFLASHPGLAWGKKSARLRVSLAGVANEIHLLNNLAEEYVLTE